ncbi:MAG TPA: hypothetical protein VJ020_10640 [Anaerolineales bacterium]|nr:hypothetical protein [Anaerolineales bacterium]
MTHGGEVARAPVTTANECMSIESSREPVPTGHGGRPRLPPWGRIVIAQVGKQYAGHQVVGIIRRIVPCCSA